MYLAKILVKLSKDSSSSSTVCVNTFETPLGKAVAVADDQFLYVVCFEDSKNLENKLESVSEETSCKFVEKKNNILDKFEEELTDYFDGKLKKFSVPLRIIGSEFQKEVWAKLKEIPYGSRQTYGDLAKALGRPVSHARAIGAACGANTHMLVIPCHRLVASGSTGGFNSGVNRKEWLLDHEKKYSN